MAEACRFFRSGKCNAGTSCRFSHNLESGRSTSAPIAIGAQSLVPCKFFEKGACKHGTNCRFAHISHEENLVRSRAPSQTQAVSWSSAEIDSAFFSSAADTSVVSRFCTGSALSSVTTLEGNVEGADDDDDAVQLMIPSSLGQSPVTPPTAGSTPPHLTLAQSTARATDQLEGLVSHLIIDDDEQRIYHPSEYTIGQKDDRNSYAFVARTNVPQTASAQPEYSPLSRPPQTQSLPTEEDKLCIFHLQGNCRYASKCRYIHGDECDICHKPCLHPYNREQNEAHRSECAEQAITDSEKADSAHAECGICGQIIVEKPTMFGLLSHCDCPFCLECIREWRSGSDVAHSTSRACPTCRQLSHFVIPSDRLVTGERKARIVDNYQQKLASIPCKYHAYGEGKCPFGASCFYQHVNKDGSIDQEQITRRYVGGDGDVRVLSTMRLADFF